MRLFIFYTLLPSAGWWPVSVWDGQALSLTTVACESLQRNKATTMRAIRPPGTDLILNQQVVIVSYANN